MFAVRIAWNYHAKDAFPDYSMFACSKYNVIHHSSKNITLEMFKGIGEEEASRVVCLSKGATAFIMNDRGKTVDTIRTEPEEE